MAKKKKYYVAKNPRGPQKAKRTRPRKDKGGTHISKIGEARKRLLFDLYSESYEGFTKTEYVQEIVKAEGLPESKIRSVRVTITRIMNELLEEGKITREGLGKNTYYRVVPSE